VIVAQQQEQPQLAFVMESDVEPATASEYLMTRRRAARPVAPYALSACAVAMAAAYGFAVRTQKVRAR
jgi:hypothetical protein